MEPAQLLELTSEYRVLYVEDDPATLRSMVQILEKFFAEVISATNGQEGLSRFRDRKPDLVMTDVRMPVMDGLQMIDAIKNEAPDQAVIILSAHNEPDYFTDAIRKGVSDFILKPLQMNQLVAALGRTCKEIRNARDAEAYRSHLEERIEEEIRKNREKEQKSLRMMESLVQAYPNPVVVYASGEVRFSNRVFREITSDLRFSLSELIVPRKGFLSGLEEYDEVDLMKNRVVLKTGEGHRIFQILRRPVELENEEGTLYALNDGLEYREMKIRHYSERLQDLIVYRYQRRVRQEQHPQEEALPAPAAAGRQARSVRWPDCPGPDLPRYRDPAPWYRGC